MLKQRISTAVVLAAIFIPAVALLEGEWIAAFFALVWGLGAWEWAGFARLEQPLHKGLFVLLNIVLMYVWYDYASLGILGFDADKASALLMTAGVVWGVLMLWAQTYPNSATLWRPWSMTLLLGSAVIIPAWFAMVLIHDGADLGLLVICVLLIVAANDIGAFFVGKTLGKRKLAPKLSPKKTWEGFFGGISAAIIVALGLGFTFPELDFQKWMSASVVAAFAGVIGDLVESMFKREAGIKDSGNLLPGHGGFLDRLDSLSAAYPLFALVYFYS